MKKIISILLLAMLVLSFAACNDQTTTTENGNSINSTENNNNDNNSITDSSKSEAENSTSGNTETPSKGKNPFEDDFRDGVSCAILKDNAETKIALPEGFEFMDKSELAVAAEPGISTIMALLDDSAIRFTGGNSFDEYGILHVANEKDVEDVKNAVSEYLKAKREDALYRSYFPGEEYKLDEAEVKVYDQYVVYGMLSGDNRTALFSQIKNLLLLIEA